ncbi:MAG: ribonuclease III [Clostridiales bacterium]|nr:ribonuclease III [Clostridiales bacterium]
MNSRVNELYRFMEIIKYDFKDSELLNKALTHSSYINEKKKSYKDNNERLEFLGDAILDAVISEYLYNKLKTCEEGELTRMRASIVCESSLAECGAKLHLGEFFLLGKGEENTGGRNRNSLLADTLEALFGAVYLDGGWDIARKFILEKLRDTIDDAVHGKLYSDYKTRLQEIIQGQSDLAIQYETVKEEGPDHNKTFYVNVSIGNEIKGSGCGRNKKEAEQNAAKAALKNINDK